MFGKNKSGQPLSSSSQMETIIGSETTLIGTISSNGALRIDGKLEGSIVESAAVIIGENGEIQGDIVSHSVIVGGKVTGNISATASIEIMPNAQIRGDIKTAALTISEGATFEGNCTMTKEKQVIEMDLSASGIKAKR